MIKLTVKLLVHLPLVVVLRAWHALYRLRGGESRVSPGALWRTFDKDSPDYCK